MIERISSKDEVRAAVAEARREGRRIGFVPTMGALHEGHLSLVRAARARTDFVVVSIFVNPLQFGEGEDLAAYPRPLEDDIAALDAEEVEIVFVPSAKAMYGTCTQVTVEPGALATRWEGEVRSGHFVGVATVVTKLLNIVSPDLAFFGEKDYQQLQVIKKVVEDLDLGVTVVAAPTVRDGDGLALSSRNAYLSSAERADARAIPDALDAVAGALAWGERDARVLESVMLETIAAREGRVVVDYAAIVDPATLEPLERVDAPVRALVAARVGRTRLIDNCELKAPR